MESVISLGRILVVEDEAAHAVLIQEVFRRSMFEAEIVVAPTLAAAFQMLQAETWDLVFIDWRLPDGEGTTLLSSPALEVSAPMVMMTSHGDERLAVDAMRAGAADYVVKSVEAFRGLPLVAERALREARAVDELHRTKQQLRRSELGFEAIVNAVPDIIYRLDPQGLVTFISRAVTRYGYQPEELIGHSIVELVHPDDRQEAARRLAERRTGDRATRMYEIRLLTRSQQARDFQVHALPVESDPVVLIDAVGMYATTDPQPETFIGTQGVARDITERRAAEREIARLAAAMQSTADGVAILTADGAVSYANPAFERLAALAALGPAPVAELAISLQVAAGADETTRFRTRVTRPDGEDLWVGISLAEIDGPLAAAGQQVLVARDVTDAHQVEERLRQTGKLEAIGTLAGGIAHDFNNALQGIMGYTELAFDTQAPDSEAADSLEQVLVSCQRAAALTRQILTFARRGEETHGRVQPGLLIKEALQLLRPSLPPSIQLEVEIAREAGEVWGDPTQIHQVVMNLATNAYQAIGDENGAVRISLQPLTLAADSIAALGLQCPPGEYLALTVADTGPGMAPAVRDRIFEPFFTTKSVGQGTGMGLAVVHGIVTKHQGAIRVESQPGCGTRFEVYLPRAAAVAADAAAPAVAPRSPRSASLLLVDDERDSLQATARLLRRRGYRVDTANTTEEALNLAATDPQRYDALMLDYWMPGSTGAQLLATLRAAGVEAPALLVTGYVGALADPDTPPPGFAGMLQKPVTSKALAACLDEILE
jgi:PAS domain S-box-containing protein